MSSKRNHQMAPAEISDKQCFLHTAKSRVNTAQVCSSGGTCNTARTSFSNSCPICCNRQRVRCVRDTPAGLTQSLWLLQHSLEVLGEEREVCIYIAACTAGAHVDGQTTRGVLQTRREIRWWSWLPLLDSEYLWEKITFLILIWQELQSVDAGVRMELESSLILLCKAPFSLEDPVTSWKLLTAFAGKCPNFEQATFKNKHVWICPCIILLQFFTANSETLMMSKWMFDFTSWLRNERSGFQLQSESLSLQKIIEVLSCDYTVCWSSAMCTQYWKA